LYEWPALCRARAIVPLCLGRCSAQLLPGCAADITEHIGQFHAAGKIYARGALVAITVFALRPPLNGAAPALPFAAKAGGRPGPGARLTGRPAGEYCARTGGGFSP